jgi:DNA-binding XRE family transcriptional regulator
MAYTASMWEALRQWPMQTKLRTVRALLGMTQAEFANALATPLRTYNSYESGARNIPYRSWQYFDSLLKEWVATEERREHARRGTFAHDYGRMVPIAE